MLVGNAECVIHAIISGLASHMAWQDGVGLSGRKLPSPASGTEGGDDRWGDTGTPGVAAL